LVRDLLLYVKNKLNESGYTVIYWDTDSLFVNSKDNLTDAMNKLITDWANTYNKESVSISFEREGVFSKIFLLGKCHYYGILENVEEPEIKGMEMKRSSSSKYEACFQKTLVNKILDKESKESITNWIKAEKERIKTLPLEEVAFPSKIQNKEYKTEVTRANGMKFAKSFPIFIRAYENSKIINKKFTIKKGESFYYVYTKSLGKDKNGKIIDVLAFTDEDKHLIDKTKVNWEEMIRRNILMKARNIFEAMKWSLDMELQNQGVLF
jgi:DNA polymerase elongation subunit (family B)